MSLRVKVIGSVLCVLVLTIGAQLMFQRQAAVATKQLGLVNELFLPVSRKVVQLQADLHAHAEDLREFHFKTKPETSSNSFSRMARDIYPYVIEKRFQSLEELLNRYGTGSSSHYTKDLSTTLKLTRKQYQKWKTTKSSTEFNRSYSAIRGHLRALLEISEEKCQLITQKAQNEGKDALMIGVALLGIVFFLGAFFVLYANRLLSPLPQLIQNVRSIADGDFSQTLKVNANEKDEVAVLARECNRMFGAIRDRDREISQQQKKLLQQERLAAIGQLSAEIVHEIRNPLNSLSLNLDWLEQESMGNSSEIKKTLRSMSKEVSRLNQIAERYLVRAKVKVVSELSADANKVIQEILEFSKEEDRTNKIDVQTTLSPNKVLVRMGEPQLKQVILNVIKNAKEAMPRGGTLKVCTDWKENTSVIEVKDTGHGMNERTRRQTFTPFHSTKPHGTGLGMALTRTMVEAVNGSIQCESTLGRGTTFRFQFPA